MAPKVGDTVFVAVHDELQNTDTVHPAIVTYVYGPGDGDGRWWEAAKDKGIVDATVFNRGGGITSGTYGKTEQVTVDDGLGGTLTYPVGYATTVDGHGDVTAQPSGAAAPVPVSQPAPVAVPQGLSDADIARLAAALKAQETEPAPADPGDGLSAT